MTMQAELSTSLDAARSLADQVVAEVQHQGPNASGFYDTLSFNGVDIDVAASAGWGVQLAINTPKGTVKRHLGPDEITSPDAVLDALATLLAP